MKKIKVGIREDGSPLLLDFEKNPHLLIAGATGSGKSVALNTIIFNLMKEKNNEFILIDPKRVEFYQFRNSSQLYNFKIIEEINESIEVLEDIKSVMMLRFEDLKKYDCKSIIEFNSIIVEERKKMTHIFICVDELAFLINQNKKKVTQLLSEIAMLGRAAGIHLILATQRPDRKIIDGQILANISIVIGLKVRTSIESRLIISSNDLTQLKAPGNAIISNGLQFEKFKIDFTDSKEIEKYINSVNEEEEKEINIPPLPIRKKSTYFLNIDDLKA